MSFEDIEDLFPELVVHTVAFDHAENAIEVTFAERRDQAEGVGLIKTVAFERELFDDEVKELVSDLKNLLDEVMIAIRNKDARQARIDKALARLDPEDPEDDDED